MPAPQKSLLTQLTKVNFDSKQIKLPTDWQQPGDQYPDAFAASERAVAPNPPMTLFREETLNQYHVDTSKTIGDAFNEYIDGICEAICDGIDKWMKGDLTKGIPGAAVTNLIINGPAATFVPGSVIGPPLAPLILDTAPMDTPQQSKYSTAIANTLGTAWQAWHMGLVGVAPIYPAFAAMPSPVAPPTPNLPLPLIALSSPGEALLAPSVLQMTMMANLGDPTALHAMDLFDALSKAFNTVFQTFKATTTIQNVLGTGPVPTFAPPFVPVGPVVMGMGNSIPGSSCLT